MSFWGKTCAAATALTTVYVGVAKGAYNVASGNGSFQEGVDSVVDPAMEAAERFGDKHGDKLTGVAISLGGKLVGAEIDKHRHPK